MLGSFELIEEVINSVFGKLHFFDEYVRPVSLWDPFSLHHSIRGAPNRPVTGRYHFSLYTLGL
jgi:hypothetical protein